MASGLRTQLWLASEGPQKHLELNDVTAGLVQEVVMPLEP